MNRYQKGDIVLVDFGKCIGSVECGLRPALIICNNKALKNGRIATVLPITSRLKNLPTHVNIILKNESQILAEQITTIDINSQCIKYIGRVSNDTIIKVHSAIIMQLGLSA